MSVSVTGLYGSSGKSTGYVDKRLFYIDELPEDGANYSYGSPFGINFLSSASAWNSYNNEFINAGIAFPPVSRLGSTVIITGNDVNCARMFSGYYVGAIYYNNFPKTIVIEKGVRDVTGMFQSFNGINRQQSNSSGRNYIDSLKGLTVIINRNAGADFTINTFISYAKNIDIICTKNMLDYLATNFDNYLGLAMTMKNAYWYQNTSYSINVYANLTI